MIINIRAAALAVAFMSMLEGCAESIPKAQTQGRENLEMRYVLAFQSEPGSKKCLAPKQLNDGKWFTLCGFNDGSPSLRNGGLWELREENGSWVAYAANGKAAAAQSKLVDQQIKPPETPPSFDVGKARNLFP